MRLDQRRKRVEIEKRDLFDLGAWARRPGRRSALEPNIDPGWPATRLDEKDVINLDLQTGLLTDLTPDRFRECFPVLKEAARQSPRGEGSVRVAKEHELIALVENDAHDADKKPVLANAHYSALDGGR